MFLQGLCRIARDCLSHRGDIMDNIFKPNTNTKENCHLLVVLSLAQQPLSATCSHLQLLGSHLAATCSSSHLLKQPLAATCSHSQTLAPSGCSKWLPGGLFFENPIAHLLRPQCRLINIEHVLNSLCEKFSCWSAAGNHC